MELVGGVFDLTVKHCRQRANLSDTSNSYLRNVIGQHHKIGRVAGQQITSFVRLTGGNGGSDRT